MQPNLFPVTLENIVTLTPNVKHFVFKSIQEPAFDFIPGQFITMHFEVDGKTLRRSYSIANTPTQNNRIEFAAGFVEDGPGSDLLFNLQIGDTLHINGPFGRLILKEATPKRYLLVATSTGVTPYRAMREELKRRMRENPSLSVVLLQGAQTREDILYTDEFLALSAEYPQFSFRACLSRKPTHELHAHETVGYVQSLFPELLPNPAEDAVYLCGNPGMIDDAFTYLKNQGFDVHNVVREKYLSAKTA